MTSPPRSWSRTPAVLRGLKAPLSLLLVLLLLLAQPSSPVLAATASLPSHEGGAQVARPLIAAATWLAHPTKNSPPAAAYPAMAYDPADGYVVLFGGCLAGATNDCTSFSDQTWVYQGGVWSNFSEIEPHPSARFGASMAWDAQGGYLVLFGGGGPNGVLLNDTWTFVGGHWTNITGSAGQAPPGRQNFAMFNDTADNDLVVCCGGAGSTGDTWTFQGGAWSPSTATLPPRCCTVGTFDTAASHGVLFGGGNHGALGDTWFYAGGLWSQGPSGPTAGASVGLSYDPTYGYDLLYGGGNGVGLDQTWTLSGSSWTQQSPSAMPSGRCCQGQVFDAADGYVLLFGGSNGVTSPFDNDTWLWTNSNPLLLSSFLATPDPVDVGVSTTFSVSASGGTPSYTYAFSGLPPGCANSATATLTCTPTAPGAYTVDAWVNDSAADHVEGRLLLTVTALPTIPTFLASPNPTDVGTGTTLTPVVSGGAPPFSYAYTGLPTGCTNVSTSALVCVPSATGTFSVSVALRDSDGHTATGSLSLKVDTDPVVTSFTATPNPQDPDFPVAFSMTAQEGTSPYAYSYAGLPPGCAGALEASFSCTPALSGTFAVEANATDAAGRSAYGFLNLTVERQAESNLVSATPDVVDVGVATVIKDTVLGGIGPYSYAYAHLPGCTSQDAATFSCLPSETGTFVLQANATDSSGDVATATTTLLVRPALAITEFRAAHLPLDVGDVLELTVTTTGGTGAPTLSYASLPAGCTSSNTTSLSCTPTVQGSFTVVATATDTGGGSASQELDLTIDPALRVVSFGANPAHLTLGGRTQLSLTVDGGATPYAISYVGLPPGCTAANSTTLSCDPTQAGDFLVLAVAVDMAESSAEANTTLFVVAPSTTPYWDRNTLGLPLWGWLVALLVIAGLVLLAVLFVGRRRRDRMGPPPGAPQEQGWTGGTAPGPDWTATTGATEPGWGAPAPEGPALPGPDEVQPGPPPPLG